VKPGPRELPDPFAVVSLIMHYAFDMFLAREFPTVEFERYADDGVPRTLKEAPM
jgi:RNA-directed DNA polymerase